MEIDNIIVGAGISGIVLARRIAEEIDEKVLLLDRRFHIGGYCYDCYDDYGILIHKYGPHIFRTDDKEVWNYMSRFTQWIDYQHKVLAYVCGKLYPMPINLDTINGVLGANYNSEDVLDYFKSVSIDHKDINNVENVITSQVGKYFYEIFFKNYTEKQWGENPARLPKEIVSRIPIRNNRDDRYFTVKYQAMPKYGYTKMFERMLDHPNIKVLLNTDYKEIRDLIKYKKLYYSGSIDEFYNYRFGELPYRCVSFEFENLPKEHYQDVAVVNYPNDYDYTRITEFKHLTGQQSCSTTIAREYSSDKGDRSYPIPKKENIEIYNQYQELSKSNEVTFIGRLGKYKYYSMDQTIKDMLSLSI